MKKKNCDKCNREIKNCNYSRHYNSCKGVKKEYKQIGDKYECPHCFKLFKKLGIKGHVWRLHTSEGALFFREYKKGKSVWNKGLTKETDERVKKQNDTFKKNLKEGKFIPKGRKHTQEIKDKISKKRIDFLLANPDKVPYLLNHSSKESYPEKIFREALIRNNIKGWIQEYRNGLYSYDFAFLDLKIDVEIDGGTHNSEKVKLIDAKRDDWSNKQGWKVIRFTAKEIKNNIDNCINKLKVYGI